MNITNTIVLSFDAPDNDALDEFDEYTDRLVEKVVDDSGGVYRAEATRRVTLVPAIVGLDEYQLHCVIAELETCLENTPVDHTDSASVDSRRALINFLAGMGVTDLPEV